MKAISPVFTKEMISLSRRKRHYVIRAGFLGILLLQMGIMWGSLSRMAMYQGFGDMSLFGHRMFVAFNVTQLIAILIVVPALTAPVIATEKDRDTLGLLLMTNLSTSNILLDKLLSRLALMALLFLSAAPLFLVLLAFGGILPRQILNAYLGLFATLVGCAGIGLLMSTLLRRAWTAIIATYAFIAVYVFALVFLAEGIDVLDDSVLSVMLPVGMFDGSMDDTLVFLVAMSCIFLLSFLVCRRLVPRMVGQKKRAGIKILFDWLNRWFRRINFTGVELLGNTDGPMGSAILWKETHKSFFCSTPFLVRSCYVLLMVSIVVLAFMSGDFDDAAWFTCVLGAILVGVVSVVAGAASFTKEREKKSFDTLMTLPVAGHEIVLSKFIGVVRLLLPIIFWMVLWIGIAELTYTFHWNYYYSNDEHVILQILVALIAFMPMLIVIGLFCSALCRRTAGAMLWAFVVVLIWTLSPVVIFVGDELDFWSVPYELETFVWSTSPIISIIGIVDEDFSIWCALTIVPCWIILLSALCCNFDRIVGRR